MVVLLSTKTVSTGVEVARSKSSYPKLLGIELENFQAIKKAKLVFDESNILNLKGYNDSGKSAITRAMEVLFMNAYPSAQKNFIRHGEHYFRVTAHFEDGISIIRDKYLTGASLYEMYSGKDLVFSTKVGSTLTKVTGVPLEIKEYLGMTETKEGSYLNAQSIYDKQFLIQTTGSENVELLNGVLRIKETGLAITAIKTDINKVQSDINTLTSDIKATELSLERYSELDVGFIELLISLDDKYKSLYSKCMDFNNLKVLYSNYVEYLNSTYKSILSFELPTLSLGKADKLKSLVGIQSTLGKIGNLSISPVYDKVISKEKLVSLTNLSKALNSYSQAESRVLDELPLLSSSKMNDLSSLASLLSRYSQKVSQVQGIEDELSKINVASKELETYAINHNIAISTCGNCGSLVQGVVGVGGHSH